MKEIFIKYNPYSVKTDITIDGKKIPDSSVFHDNMEKHLQEWVDEFPQLLHRKCNDEYYNITFHGTALDYDDFKGSLECYSSKCQDFKFKLSHKPAKESKDKLAKIKDIYNKIKKRIEEDTEFADWQILDSTKLDDAFKNALGNECKVYVVATMSAGKSTLINALLGHKLMPSKQEACTAVITQIKDKDSKDGNAPYRAEAYDAIMGGNIVAIRENAFLEDMEYLNADSQKIKRIEVTGDIPFVSSDEASLVLIDTPGPNNSRTEAHKNVQQEMLDSTAKSFILYVMTGEFGTNDDRDTLQNVAKSMSSGGKRSRDRFLFVVNKLDGRKEEDGALKDFLQGVRKHLGENGIKDPIIFPAAALPALNIRLWQKNQASLSKYEQLELQGNILKFNEILHFDEEASLPLSLREKINQALQATRQAWRNANTEDNDNPEEALIHTGIPSIEAAIQQYMEKYSKPDQINILHDTFKEQVEKAKGFADLIKKIEMLKSEAQEIQEKIDTIKSKINEGNEAKKYKEEIKQHQNEALEKVNEGVEKKVSKLYETIDNKIYHTSQSKLEINMLDMEIDKLKYESEKLQGEFKNDVDNIINQELFNICNNIINDYKKHISSIFSEIDKHSDFRIDPFKLTSFQLDTQFLKNTMKSFEIDEKIESGKEWIENENKAWYKPWTWGEESGHWRTTYTTHKYIPYKELNTKVWHPIKKELMDSKGNIKKFAEEQCARMGNYLEKIFDDLDNQLQCKMDILYQHTCQKETTEAERERNENRLKWFESIKAEMETILDI